MTVNKKNSESSWIDPDDAPEWTRDVFERAALYDGDKLIRPAQGTLSKRGRPRLENPKRQVTLRLDGDVIDRLRATGPGWQSRINEILKRAVGE
jgi:uncharacterized protein (DUF4415 family)